MPASDGIVQVSSGPSFYSWGHLRPRVTGLKVTELARAKILKFWAQAQVQTFLENLNKR